MSDKQYMCILRREGGECDQPSPSDMEAMFAKYQTWQDKFKSNIADMGAGLSEIGSVVSQAGVKDGPFVEIKEMVGGYMMLTAASLEEAIAVIKASPMIENPNVSIEIRELSTQ